MEMSAFSRLKTDSLGTSRERGIIRIPGQSLQHGCVGCPVGWSLVREGEDDGENGKGNPFFSEQHVEDCLE